MAADVRKGPPLAEDGGDSHVEGQQHHELEQEATHHFKKQLGSTKRIVSSLVAGGIAGWGTASGCSLAQIFVLFARKWREIATETTRTLIFLRACAKSVIAPLERVKILFQVTDRKFSFKEAYLAMSDLYRKEGVRSLWRGNSATVIRIMPYAAIQFMTHEQYKIILRYLNRAQPRETSLEKFTAGALAGFTATTATYPLDLMRARLAVQVYGGQYSGSLFSSFRTMLVMAGPLSLFRGLFPTLAGIVPYAGTSFFTYETLKKEFLGPAGGSTFERWLCGAVAGLFGQSATYPLDVIRRRMQTNGLLTTTPNPAYRTMLTTITYIVRTEGVRRGLYKGLSMNWIKGPIAAGISFSVFDLLKDLSRKWNMWD